MEFGAGSEDSVIFLQLQTYKYFKLKFYLKNKKQDPPM